MNLAETDEKQPICGGRPSSGGKWFAPAAPPRGVGGPRFHSMNTDILEAVEAYIAERIKVLAKCQPKSAEIISELEAVRNLCAGLRQQFALLQAALDSPRRQSDV